MKEKKMLLRLEKKVVLLLLPLHAKGDHKSTGTAEGEGEEELLNCPLELSDKKYSGLSPSLFFKAKFYFGGL